VRAGRVVLVVDDEAITRDVVVAMLELDHVAVHHAADGESALKVAADVRPDVVLLDVMMPGMNGFDVCRALCDTPTPPRVVMLTARADADARAAAFEAGATGYLVKPFSARDLFAVVDEESAGGA
jgi:DNA-binding response OmpR family regulator